MKVVSVLGARPQFIKAAPVGKALRAAPPTEVLGFNSRLDSLQAAMLGVKVKYLDGGNEARRRVAQRYNELLALWNTNYSAGLALSSNYSTGWPVCP